MSVYILSTMSMPISYCFYENVNRNANAATQRNPVTGDVPLCKKKINIHGGAGIPSLRSGFGEMSRSHDGQPLWTADGVVTPISEADYELLKENPVFQKHERQGRVKVLKRDVTENHKAVAKEAAGMSKDPFGLMTADKLEKIMKRKVKAGTGPFGDDENRI